jgi:4'-phosphopantetheinyl transferase
MIDILCIKIDEKFDFEKYLGWFDLTIQTKINQFYHYKDKVISFTSELIKKYYLSKYLNISPLNIDIQYTKYGKPYIKRPQLHFNISHSGDYLIIAISNKYQLGIDIEKCNYDIVPNELTKLVFDFSEQLFIKNDINKFYQLWTKKESLIKAYGIGFIGNEFRNIKLDLNCIKEFDNIAIYNTNLFNNYSLAICVLND